MGQAIDELIRSVAEGAAAAAAHLAAAGLVARLDDFEVEIGSGPEGVETTVFVRLQQSEPATTGPVTLRSTQAS